MSKAKLVVLAIPVVFSVSLAISWFSGLSFISSLLILAALPTLPFLVKPLAKGLLLLPKLITLPIKGLAHLLKIALKAITKLTHNFLKLFKLLTKPAFIAGLIVGIAARLAGFPLPYIVVSSALTTTLILSGPKLIHLMKQATQIIISNLRKAMKKVQPIPFKAKILGFGFALFFGSHPLAAFLTGLLMPSFIRLDKYLFIGLGFALRQFIPPAFGLFTYAGSGFIEPLVVSLIIHKAVEKILLAHLKSKRNSNYAEPMRNYFHLQDDDSAAIRSPLPIRHEPRVAYSLPEESRPYLPSLIAPLQKEGEPTANPDLTRQREGDKKPPQHRLVTLSP